MRLNEAIYSQVLSKYVSIYGITQHVLTTYYKQERGKFNNAEMDKIKTRKVLCQINVNQMKIVHRRVCDMQIKKHTRQ